jgi:uncharacterized membrane protein YkvA (DUF1232 family)
MKETYIDYWRKKLQELRDSGEDFDSTLLHFPELVKLLCDILDTDVVDRESRVMITSALGYLLAPDDVLPEDAYGVYGYMDDMYVTCVVLSNLKQKYPSIVSELWLKNNNDSFDTVLDLCTFRSEKFLDEKNLKSRVLRYCGLAD